MKEPVKAVRYTCDGCGVEHLIANDRDNEPPLGFHGEGVGWIHPGGGWGCTSWYACSEECIGPAVVAAITRESTL